MNDKDGAGHEDKTPDLPKALLRSFEYSVVFKCGCLWRQLSRVLGRVLLGPSPIMGDLNGFYVSINLST